MTIRDASYIGLCEEDYYDKLYGKPEPICYCDECGEPIYETISEGGYDIIEGTCYCKNCLRMMEEQ